MSRAVLKIVFGCSVTLIILGLLFAGILTGLLIFAPEHYNTKSSPETGKVTAVAETAATGILKRLERKVPLPRAIKREANTSLKKELKKELSPSRSKQPGEDMLTSNSQQTSASSKNTADTSKPAAAQAGNSPETTSKKSVAAAKPSAQGKDSSNGKAAKNTDKQTLADAQPAQKVDSEKQVATTKTPAATNSKQLDSKKKQDDQNFKKYTLLLGSYVNRAQAENEASRLANIGELAEIQVTNEFPVLYSVFTGKFAAESKAQHKADSLAKHNGLYLSIAPATAHRTISKTAGTPVWLAEFMSFLTIEGAMRQHKQLMKKGIKSKIVKTYDSQKKLWFTIIAGQFPKKKTATDICKKYKKKTPLSCFVRPIAKSMVIPYTPQSSSKKQNTPQTEKTKKASSKTVKKS